MSVPIIYMKSRSSDLEVFLEGKQNHISLIAVAPAAELITDREAVHIGEEE